jgi:hypothetical protein
MQFIYGLIGIILCFIIIKYRHQIIKLTGRFSWAENKLGHNGSAKAIFLISIIFMIISFLFMIGQESILFGGFEKYV